MLPHRTGLATFASAMFNMLPNTFTYRDAVASGISDRALRGFVEAGSLDHVGHGLYRKAEAPPADLDLVELALRAPNATLCLASALAYHDLSDAIPTMVEAALPRTQRPPRLTAPVRWHRFDAQSFAVGRNRREVEPGLFIGCYDAERTIVDAFRLRHREGEELAVEALRRWLRMPHNAPASLLAVARHFPHAEPSLLHALRVLT